MPLEDLTATPLPQLPERPADSHKGDYGRALVVGGSRGMSGAVALAGLAALRGGAGLVTLAVPRSIQDVVASFDPSYMTQGLADDGGRFSAAAADEVLALASGMTAVAIGPGLGRSPALTELVERLHQEIAQPMVIDADALFALSEQRDVLATAGGPRIVTPHAGEFARLIDATGATGSASADIEEALAKPVAPNASQDDTTRRTAAAELAASAPGTIVVLKGHRTVVTDGRRVCFNQTGNPGLATGGSGDVLTGVITALLSQGLEPFDAARLGVHLHGLAGDWAAEQLGQASLIASDLIDFLPSAFESMGEF